MAFLMVDEENSKKTHTLWVYVPVPLAESEENLKDFY